MYYKNYANFIRVIFGEKSDRLDEESINLSQELAETVEQQLLELWSPFSLEYAAIDRFILNGKEANDFADYIRMNADHLADLYMSRALRQLRQPECADQLRPYIKHKEK